ncbi:hypothetical protein [Enterococcus sp. DIV0187]|uniref:hypothetical protein n=1 Tax=Enterococcus sp. DIV0187 TaxID=2774644 RepID=UPI003F251CA2
MDLVAKLINDEYFDFDGLVKNLDNERIGKTYRLKFCRFLHDICELYTLEKNELLENTISFYVKDKNGNKLVKTIKYLTKDRYGNIVKKTRKEFVVSWKFKSASKIDNYYNVLKYRSYYYLLFNFIYFDYSLDDVLKFRKLLEERLNEEKYFEPFEGDEYLG